MGRDSKNKCSKKSPGFCTPSPSGLIAADDDNDGVIEFPSHTVMREGVDRLYQDDSRVCKDGVLLMDGRTHTYQ